MLKPTRYQRLQASPIDLQILRGVNVGLLGLTQRLGPWSPESYDQNFRPAILNLFEKLPRLLCAQIEQKKRHPVYGKIVRRSSKLAAHDEANDAHVGDTVRVAGAAFSAKAW
jgi:hypothetical protein